MILLDKNFIKVSAHQPNFIPWVGFWHKLLHSNVFVITTGMQYVRRGFSNRVIMGDNNSWATVPVKADFIAFNKIKITDLTAVRQIGKRILHWSKQKKYLFSYRLEPIIEKLINIEDKSLSSLNVDLIKIILKILDHKSTEIIVDNRNWRVESKLDIIFRLLKENGDLFLSGPTAEKYLDKKNSIELKKKIVFQKLIGNIKNETILHAIAFYENPVDYIINSAEWKYIE